MLLTLHAHGQDAYINGHDWYGHEVDSCYLNFDAIRDQGDPTGTFSYARRHLRTMTQFTHGEPVYVTDTKIVPPHDVTLVSVRRVGENTTYWTEPAALSDQDPLAGEKAAAHAAYMEAEQARLKRARENTRREQATIDRLKAERQKAQPVRRPIAQHRYWQVGSERFQGKLVNANDKFVKIRKSSGASVVVERQYLTETSETYVSEMLQHLKSYREYVDAMASSS